MPICALAVWKWLGVSVKTPDKTLAAKISGEPEETQGTERLNGNIEKLAYMMERINLSEYMALMQNTRRLLLVNFTCGLARGFGMALGMTALVAVFLIILSKIAALPFVPGYIARLILAIQSQMSK